MPAKSGELPREAAQDKKKRDGKELTTKALASNWHATATMSSFFTAPVGEKKRKRPSASEGPKKRLATTKTGGTSKSTPGKGTAKSQAAPKKAIERDDSISGSDLDTDDEVHPDDRDSDDSGASDNDSEHEGETAAEKRLRLAQRYLEKTRKEVDELQGEWDFDAEEIDRDLLAERLQEDVAEAKGKVYRNLVAELDFGHAAHTQWRWNSGTVTSVAVCAPFAYTTTKDGQLVKWRLQDLPKDQWPQTTKKKPKKPPAPPKRRPERVCTSKSNPSKAKDRTFQGHTAAALLTVKASQDGKFVVTGGIDRRMVVHDAETLKPIKAFTQHRDAVTGLAFRRGTNQIFSCSKDRTVKVWSLDELAYIETLFGHQDEIPDIDALAGERCVSVGARDRTARYWKVPEESQLVFRGGASEKKSKKKSKDGEPQQDLTNEGTMDRVAMIDDELFVTGSSENGALALWSINRKKAVHTVPAAHGIEPAAKPEEVSAEKNPDPKKVVPTPQPRAITALRTIPYSDVILSGSYDGCVRVWQLSEDKKKILPVGVLGEPNSSANSATPTEEEEVEEQLNGVSHEKKPEQRKNGGGLVRGVVNDIAIFERGERGRDGVCVVVATGKEMRLGRWKHIKDGRCGAMVFEIPKLPRQGKKDGDDDEDDDGEGEDSE